MIGVILIKSKCTNFMYFLNLYISNTISNTIKTLLYQYLKHVLNILINGIMNSRRLHYIAYNPCGYGLFIFECTESAQKVHKTIKKYTLKNKISECINYKYFTISFCVLGYK